MQIHNVQQGSPEWYALRAKYKTASEAPAALGASKYQTRGALLNAKKFGIAAGVGNQFLFDKGHIAEAGARPFVEEAIGQELYPVTVSEGEFLASLDGMTMDGKIIFEHKLLNKDLAAMVTSGQLSAHYYWQLEHQLMVTGAERVVFAISDGTEDSLMMLDYRPVPGRREELLAGWAQFDIDLAAYESKDVDVAVAASIDALPVLLVDIEGSVKSTNLVTYKEAVTARIEAIKTDLQTDQDFADAEKTVKFLGDAEKELEAVKARALAQTASIDELFRAIDSIKASARDKRLSLEKLVTKRKDQIRVEIRNGAAAEVASHIDAINKTLGGKIVLPPIADDFAGVMKNKRTVASLRSAVDDEVVRIKLEANRIADKIRLNLAILKEQAAGFEKLFGDAQQLVLKERDDLTAVIKIRIADHKAELAKVAEKAVEAERAKVAVESMATKKVADEYVDAMIRKPANDPRQDIIEYVAMKFHLNLIQAEAMLVKLFSKEIA